MLPTDVPDDVDTFGTRAAEILGKAEPVTAGKLHLSHFERIKERFSPTWSHTAPKAEGVMRQAIEKRLAPVEAYGKGDALDFVILFPSLSAQEARVKCAQIADEIARALAGDFGAELAQVETSVAAIDPKLLLPVPEQQGELVEAIAAEIAKAPPAKEEAAASTLDQVRFLFRPIWDVKRQAVFNFLCVPVMKTPGGRIVSGEGAIEGLSDRHMRLDYDLRLLKRVVDELTRMGSEDRRLLFTIPVHVDTVSSAAFRTEYLKLWRRVPLSLQRLAIFDLVGGSDGFPQSRLIEILPSLKPMSRAVTLRMPIGSSHSFSRFAHVGLHALSAEAPPGREENAIGDIEKFVIAAEKAHLLTYLHGIRTGSLALAAVGAGFSFIDGPSIGSAEANPKEALRYSMEDLYAKR